MSGRARTRLEARAAQVVIVADETFEPAAAEVALHAGVAGHALVAGHGLQPAAADTAPTGENISKVDSLFAMPIDSNWRIFN